MNKSRQALYDIFMSQTVTELQLHRKYFDAYRVKSNARKAQLAEALAELFVEEPISCLKRLPLYELRILEKLAEVGKGESLELNRTAMGFYTVTAGLTQLNLPEDSPYVFEISFAPGVYPVLAPYVGEVVREIENSPQAEHEQFFWGMLTIYGAIKHHEFYDLLDHYFPVFDDRVGFYNFMLDYPFAEHAVSCGYLLHPCVDVIELLREREEKKMTKRVYKKFSMQDIMDAGATMPYSYVWGLHEEGKDLISALKEIGYQNERMLSYAMHRIWDNKQYSGSSAKAFNGLVAEILGNVKVSSFAQVQKVAGAIMRYSNAIPCWCFKGRSSDEMFKQDKQGLEKLANAQAVVHQMANISRQASAFPKVGRNDPCPCGSGLKYKNCHGKNLN